MNLNDMQSIVDAFKAKAKDRPELLYDHGVISDNRNAELIGEVRHGGLSIFDGEDDSSQKVASIHYQGNGEVFCVTLHIGMNEFQFVENPSLCVELIERLVKIPEATKKSILP